MQSLVRGPVGSQSLEISAVQKCSLGPDQAELCQWSAHLLNGSWTWLVARAGRPELSGDVVLVLTSSLKMSWSRWTEHRSNQGLMTQIHKFLLKLRKLVAVLYKGFKIKARILWQHVLRIQDSNWHYIFYQGSCGKILS